MSDDDKIVEGFSEHLIADGYGYAFAVMAGDIDGDGDLDLSSGDATDNFLYWYENDGDGRFTRHFVQKDDPGWFERHDLGDVDGDGDLDIIIVKNQVGQLHWFENSGNPREEKLWKKHTVSSDFKRAYDVALKDLDGDGDLDAAATNYVSGQVVWFENPGKYPESVEWNEHIIDKDIGETRTIRFADFNADGIFDLFTTTRTTDLVVWYQNPGKSTDTPWKKHIVDDKTIQPTHGHAVDFDGDGDADIILGAGMLADTREEKSNEVIWYENVGTPGDGSTWGKHRLARFEFAFEAFAGDIDGDGDLDVAATAFGGNGGVIWLENNGDPHAEFTKHILKEIWPKANQIIMADLNGDGRLDIAASNERGANEIRWWRNEIRAKGN
ncbi:MAG: VCBS repeat-containing protein [Planctomycetota bacterium]|nr:VCBS repeat-containing protein [Planctomycetota bacterium]MDA1212030.1 VCBS repeat-containing protein [Planctomycetota bacterium]